MTPTLPLILHANDHLYWSHRQLGFDPPNIDLSAQAIADADEDAATGHKGWDKWLAALRSLRQAPESIWVRSLLGRPFRGNT